MNKASSTAYTGLLALDNQTLLLSYDRLANGWHGPPGSLGDSDYVFSMRVTIKPAAHKPLLVGVNPGGGKSRAVANDSRTHQPTDEA
jgi:hypothetical protein